MSFVIDELIAQKALVPLDSGLALPGHEARIQPKEQELTDRVEGLYRKAGFEPPLDEDVVRQLHLPLNDFRKVLGILLKEGQLVRLDPRIIYHCESFERAKSLLVDFLRVRREITIADAKVVLRVSRKFACAVLEHLDRIHMTCRKGDVHVLK
jgi:selenocysteine-specific elongation factor